MKWIKQFGIILAVSFIGELLGNWIPLPIPASIYGIILLFLCLKLHLIPFDDVHETGDFLIEIMPLMFIPAAVGLLESWDIIRPSWIQYILITVSTTFIVMVAAGLVTQAVIRRTKKGDEKMLEFLKNSAFFGVLISVLSYGIGMLLKKKWKLAIFNPLLISIALTIAALSCLHINYDTYNEGAKYLSYLLTPATVCLAIPLYEQLELLKHNWKAIVLGILSGVLASLGSILGMAVLFGMSHEEYVTFLPKSITTAIGMGVSEKLGGLFPSVLLQSSLPEYWATSLPN